MNKDSCILFRSHMLIIAFLVGVGGYGCSSDDSPENEYEELMLLSQEIGWDANSLKVDSLENGDISVQLSRFSQDYISDFFLFNSHGLFKVYYFMPGPDHYFELMIRRKSGLNHSLVLYDIENYWGFIKLTPDSVKSFENQLVMSAVPLIGEYGIRLLDENSTEILVSDNLQNPLSLKDFFNLINAPAGATEVSFIWFWRGWEDKQNIMETTNHIRIFLGPNGWDIERFGAPKVDRIRSKAE